MVSAKSMVSSTMITRLLNPQKVPEGNKIHWINSMSNCRIEVWNYVEAVYYCDIPDSKVHGANMGPTWVLSAPDGPHIGPMNLAIRDCSITFVLDANGCNRCINYSAKGLLFLNKISMLCFFIKVLSIRYKFREATYMTNHLSPAVNTFVGQS